MKAVVATFNQEKALVGAFSVIVKTGCGTDGALHGTKRNNNLLPYPLTLNQTPARQLIGSEDTPILLLVQNTENIVKINMTQSQNKI